MLLDETLIIGDCISNSNKKNPAALQLLENVILYTTCLLHKQTLGVEQVVNSQLLAKVMPNQ